MYGSTNEDWFLVVLIAMPKYLFFEILVTSGLEKTMEEPSAVSSTLKPVIGSSIIWWVIESAFAS